MIRKYNQIRPKPLRKGWENKSALSPLNDMLAWLYLDSCEHKGVSQIGRSVCRGVPEGSHKVSLVWHPDGFSPLFVFSTCIHLRLPCSHLTVSTCPTTSSCNQFFPALLSISFTAFGLFRKLSLLLMTNPNNYYLLGETKLKTPLANTQPFT